MEEEFIKACQEITRCLNISGNIAQDLSQTTTLPENKIFWDLKAILSTVGIALSFLTQLILVITSKNRRKKDKRWEMFKDEIYNPFLSHLESYEKQINASNLTGQLNAVTDDNEILGKIHSKLSEVHLWCNRADRHECNQVPSFKQKFMPVFFFKKDDKHNCKKLWSFSNSYGVLECDLRISEQDGSQETIEASYKNIHEELRSELSSCRKQLDL